jgi:hypothetical protein
MYYRKSDDTVQQLGGGAGSGNLYVLARNSSYISVPFYGGNLGVIARSGTVDVPA